MLVTPIFVQSGRCKRFLNYIVEQTLSGHASQLKERTIGINVFERANDYDTGDDSIVRVTANEVRKRIGQFYQESPQAHLVQIDLPRGSYVPEFRIQPSRQVETPVETSPSGHVEREPAVLAASTDDPPPTASNFGIPGTDQELLAAVKVSSRGMQRRRLVYPILLLLIAATIVAVWTWKVRSGEKVPDPWAAFGMQRFLFSSASIRITFNRSRPNKSPDRDRFVNLVLRRQIISLDDAAILSSMASELGKKGIPFRVVGAELTSLADLRRQPVILIGAIDNKWTLRLTQNLRYRIEVANPPDLDQPKNLSRPSLILRTPATISGSQTFRSPSRNGRATMPSWPEWMIQRLGSLS